jgi:DNA-binding transcriptional LysR family regulator
VTVPLEGVCIRRPFYLVRRKGRQLSPLALAFYEHLRRAGVKAEDGRLKTED